ncbi:MAG: hypothetical protein ACERLM_01030 [Acidimicrobiales bacterium]
MYAPDDPFAVRRPAPPVAERGDGTGHDEGPTDERAVESDIELLDRAEATFAGASEVINLVERGDLDQAEALLDSLVAPSSE